MSNVIFDILHVPTLYPFCFVLAISIAIGTFVCGKRYDAPTVGFLLITASTNLSLYLFSYLFIPLDFFVPVVLVILVILGVATRFFLFINLSSNQLILNRIQLFSIACIIGVLVYLVNTTQVNPDTGINFFQAWSPLYIKSSFEVGHFLDPEEMSLGRGFMTSAMYYAPNTIGLAAFLRAVGFEASYPVYNACTIVAKVVLVALLVSTVQSSKLALALFSILFTTFLLLEENVRVILGINYFDEILILGGAAVAFYLFQQYYKEGIYPRIKKSAFISTFMVFGRSYGAYYSFILIILFTIFCIKNPSKIKVTEMFLTWTLLVLFSLREFVNIALSGNIFYPRVNLLNIYPPTLEKLILGTLSSWGIVYFNNGIFQFNINSLYLIVIGYFFAFTLIHRQNSIKYIFLALSPLFLLCLPFSLEAIVKYRKSIDFSKLYFVTGWFFFWYPSFLYCVYSDMVSNLSRNSSSNIVSENQLDQLCRNKISVKNGQARRTERQERFAKLMANFRQVGQGIRYVGSRRSFLIYRVFLLITILLVLSFYILQGGYKFNSYQYAFQSAKVRLFEKNKPSQDELIAAAIKGEINQDELNKIIEKKILYFHYEPGIGLRYYLGGDLFKDLDYWSDPVQKVLDSEKSFASFICRLGSPNLYLSYGFIMYYQDYTYYPKRPRVVDALKNFESWSFLKSYAKNGNGIFIQLNPNKLNCEN
jgi:hypothetical protein